MPFETFNIRIKREYEIYNTADQVDDIDFTVFRNKSRKFFQYS